MTKIVLTLDVAPSAPIRLVGIETAGENGEVVETHQGSTIGSWHAVTKPTEPCRCGHTRENHDEDGCWDPNAPECACKRFAILGAA